MFKYRLQRILDLREQELEAAKVRYKDANQRVIEIGNKIKENHKSQINIKNKLAKGDFAESPIVSMNRAKFLEKEKERLEEEMIEAENYREEMRNEMIICQQKKEALEKHKEKEKEAFIVAELKKEEKELNELGLIMRRLREDEESNNQN